MDYLDIRLEVSEYLGNRVMSDVMNRLFERAEKRLSRKLRHGRQLTEATVTMADGVGTLPADFVEMEAVQNGYRNYRQTSTRHSRGRHSQTFIVEGQTLKMSGVDGDTDIYYYAALPTITTGPTGSNWLLEEAPDVYKYAAAVEGAMFLNDLDLTARAKVDLDEAMGELRRSDYRARWGEARVTLSGVTP